MPKNNNENKQENLIDGGLYRSFAPGSYVEEKDEKGSVTQRKCRAIFSSEEPVTVYDWSQDDLIREVLCMDGMQLPENRQVPLLDNHSRGEGSCSVRGSCRNMENMNNGTSETDVYFSSLADDIATLAREGHLTDLSVGYQTFSDATSWIEPGQRGTVNGKEYDNTNSKMRMAVRTIWKPFEISTTPIGADARSKFRDRNSNIKEREALMADNVEGQTPAPTANTVDVDNIRKAAVKEALEAEGSRRNQIEDSCRELGIEIDFVREDLSKLTPALDVQRKLIVEAQKRMVAAKNPGEQGGNIAITADEADKFREVATTAICIRNAIGASRIDSESAKKVEGSEIRGVDGLQALAKVCLERSGAKGVLTMSANEIAREIMGGNFGSRGAIAQASGDFAYILAAAANKFLMKGYDEIQTTYDRWIGRQSLNDFKQNKLVNMSNFSDIDWVPEGKNPEWGRFADKGELITLYKYMKAFSISFEAIVNDDKSAFSRIPSAMGGAVARKKDRATYNFLIRGNSEGTGSGVVGPTMNEDSQPMFHSTHANIGSSAAPSTPSLAEARKLLRSIKLPAPDGVSKAQYTQAPIKYIITGETQWSQWQQVLGSPAAYTNSTGSNSQTNPAIVNPFASMGIELITTPYIDEVSTTAWYFAADSNVAQHLVLATLAGEEAPQIRSAPSEIGQARGIVWDLMSIFAVGASDWRGIGKNAGA